MLVELQSLLDEKHGHGVSKEDKASQATCVQRDGTSSIAWD